MEVGEYEVWLIDENGNVMERLDSRLTRTKAPVVGEALFRDGESYRVRDVWHFDEKTRRSVMRRYSYPVLLVQRSPERAPAAPDDRGQPITSIGRRLPRRTAQVLSLVPPGPKASGDGGVAAELLGIVAALVACGYRAQADQFNAAKQLAWELSWNGKGWLLRRISDADTSAEELHELSRLAVLQYHAATALVLELSGSREPSRSRTDIAAA